MKFSLIRLSTGQSTARIPQCQCVGERSKRHHSGMDLATSGGRVNGITASPQPFRWYRAPDYRPFAPAAFVVPPFITTMTCSDFRSTLRHFTVQLLIGFAFTGNHAVAQRNHPIRAAPVPRRTSPVPQCTMQPFRPPCPGGYIGAAHSKFFAPSMAFARVKKARLPHCGRNETARFLIVRTGCLLAPKAALSWRFNERVSPPAGHQLPGCLAITRTGLAPASASQLGRTHFTIGLYPWSLPDAGQADGPLLFPTELCTRAAPRTPEGPVELTPDQGSTDIGLRRDMSGSAPSLYL